MTPLLGIILHGFIAFADEASLTLRPSVQTLTGSTFQSQRASIKAQGEIKGNDAKVFAEIYAETDAAEEAEKRRSEDVFYLQEFYLDFRKSNWFVRAGRQPVVWSEMNVNSTDIWTSYRYNRLYYDAVSEQLIHPSGLRVTYVGDIIEIDTFQNFSPTAHEFPEPLPETEPEPGYEWGIKPKIKYSRLELAGVFADQVARDFVGGTASYAFEYVVPRYETGISTSDDYEDEYFHSAGFNVYYNAWVFSLEGSYARQTQLPFQEEYQYSYFSFLYWSEAKHAIELQYYYNPTLGDSYGSAIYTFRPRDFLDISLIAQNYRGGGMGSLFDIYEERTGDVVVGLRVTGNYAL